ncbi:hypothetical protein BAUCODRAFT_29867 [Baudoinia panamericana UAMH 10762]|uniref:Non-homologous end-joining factor 1 n=1 Tax=Baudoinia panamericana (strain UAMH 10762) TaxID=717646 RepID=M2NK83_BAUPA|nr:uncharacterized protein BAUCODRAFT_29867 [Baudoinia panamericana UAMH 10762]EMC99520.1 hypothetical protein BAUCODRAFT_29867 [Baudoinia panamericana UAMH 10762]
MSRTWRVLKTESAPQSRLLVKAALEASGYAIHLTDLSRVWGETLTKREIVRRAIKEDCSIDPSEGDDQYKILLEKIDQALSERDAGTCSVKPGTAENDSVLLTLFAPLPAPLHEFNWAVDLKLLPVEHVASELVTPLLQHAWTLRGQIQQLIHALGDKDRIISKITDRLETSGNDLTTVFPGVSNIKLSRKKSQREQLARHVKGLADFDEAGWQDHQPANSSHERLDDQALNNVLAGLSATVSDELGDSNGADWWRRADENQPKSPRPAQGEVNYPHDGGVNASALGGVRSASGNLDVQEDQDDSDFQRQSTPPSVKHEGHADAMAASATSSTKKPPINVGPDDESTEDEDDLDAPSNRATRSQHGGFSHHPSQSSGNNNAAAALLHRDHTSSERSPQPTPSKQGNPDHRDTPSSKPKPKLGTIGGRGKPSVTPEPNATEQAAVASPSRPRSKLGTIGGKNKATSSAAATPAPDIPAQQSPPAKSHKLGIIGGKKANSDSAGSRHDSQQHSDRDGQPSPPRQPRASERRGTKEPTPPRETSQERADRKRAELKRQIDERAKAPVKKKRKF